MSTRISLPLAGLMGLTMLAAVGCTQEDADPSADPVASTGMSPFSIAATVSDASVDDVAIMLAEFIDEVDDTTRGVPADWLVAGASNLTEEQDVAEAVLNLPGGSKVIEVCNHLYAEQAMSFGGQHGVALPCEVAVVPNGDDVDVVLLNPEAIFGLFFHDVPAEYAAQMGGLADTVRSELEELVEDGLAGTSSQFPRENVGPVWSEDDLAQFRSMDHSIEMDLDIPAAYVSQDDGPTEFKAAFVEQLLERLTFEGAETVGSSVPGLTADDWRSARPYALGLPGNVSVVEICSPTYASAAMSTGEHHAPALPCQISVWPEGDTLRIHVLDPNYIFPVFFSDAPAEMMDQMGGLASAVQQDIVKMVEAARTDILASQPE